MDASRPLLGSRGSEARAHRYNGLTCFDKLCLVCCGCFGDEESFFNVACGSRYNIVSIDSTSSTSASEFFGTEEYSPLSSSARVTTSRSLSCWQWVFPDRMHDYEDFASTAQMEEIYYIRQKARQVFDTQSNEDGEMLKRLWRGFFPMLPYERRLDTRWKEVGFQNEDPASDLRSSGRLALSLLVYFADHMNDELQRMVEENHFPFCLCALNLIETLLVHLNLKMPPPLLCPCCGTQFNELEASYPSRSRPELKGFLSLVSDSACLGSTHRLVSTQWPVDVALAQVFAHSMLVMDAQWRQLTRQNPKMTLMDFRQALEGTCKSLIKFLARDDVDMSIDKLRKWSWDECQGQRLEYC